MRLLGGDAPSRTLARQGLRRVATASYRRFGATFLPAVNLLFDQRWDDLLVARIAEAGEPEPAQELTALADLLADSVGGYGVDSTIAVRPLARASWLARLMMGPAERDSWDKSNAWLAALADADTTPANVNWGKALANLSREEHPLLAAGGIEARKAQWSDLAKTLDQGDAGYGALAGLCAFFIYDAQSPADAQRHADLFRYNLRRELKDTPRFWVADADPDRFVEYCVGLYFLSFDRPKAKSLIEAASKGPSGALALLKGRVEQWLPPERE